MLCFQRHWEISQAALQNVFIVRHLAISPASSTTIYILKPNAGGLEDIRTRSFESSLIEMSSIQKQLAVLDVDVEWSFV